jgi:hypothetical protein
LIIGCLRKLQKWDLTSILGEFRHLTGRKIFDMEQFIEFIEMKHTRLPRRWLPGYIECYLEREVRAVVNTFLSTPSSSSRWQEEEFLAVLEEEELRMEVKQSPELKPKNSFEEEEDLLDVGLPLSPAMSRSPKAQTTTVEVSAPSMDMGPPTSSASNPLPPQRQYLISLLFQSPNRCITSSAQYDPNVRSE